MTLRQILAGTGNWLRSHRYEEAGQCGPSLDGDGLISDPFIGEDEDDTVGTSSANAPSDPVVLSSVTSLDRCDSADTLQDGLNRLVDQLQQINDHLGNQLAQHEELMDRVRDLPQRLESLPTAVENQKLLTNRLLEQLRGTEARNREFIEAVEHIPSETRRQTETLTDINHQLAAAAETDVQLATSFAKFRDTLERLNGNTISNTEGILQMSRTFAASDRYLKYVISRLNRRYAWVLATAMGVCLAVIASLVGIVVYLAR